MARVTIGNYHVFGIEEPKQLKGFPDGKMRLRMRNNAFAMAYVKTDDGIRQFNIKEKDGYWIPGHERGRNQTIWNMQ